jgi:HSP20 family protein
MRELIRQMDEVFSGVGRADWSAGAEVWPTVDWLDDGDALVLHADVPGMSEKDISIEATGRSLTIRGEKKVEAPRGYTAHRTERRTMRFARSFSLPAAIDLEAVSASVKNGVLTVKAAKLPEARPRQIAITPS